MEKNMKKRPHDFLWRGSQMESKLMPGKEVTQQRTHNSKTFDLGRGAYQTVIYPETVHFKDAEGQWKEIDNRLEEARNEQGEAILRNQSNVLTMEFAKQTGIAPLSVSAIKRGRRLPGTSRIRMSMLKQNRFAKTAATRAMKMPAARISLMWKPSCIIRKSCRTSIWFAVCRA